MRDDCKDATGYIIEKCVALVYFCSLEIITTYEIVQPFTTLHREGVIIIYIGIIYIQFLSFNVSQPPNTL